MASRNVIVFGPTGAVGSAAARTAHSYGAKVALAMRDISKSIPGLDKADEELGRYERVQADLTQPETVLAAVTETGATHAFIYITFGGSADHMRSTIEALKTGGVQSVVLLSSSSVQDDIRSVSPSDFIAFAHARVEVSLEDVFGRNGYVAVRPGFFANNTLWWRSQIGEDGEVKTAFPGLVFDYISPEDIGAVCGTILAGVSRTRIETVVLLVGPEQLPIIDAVGIVAKAIGKEAKVTLVSQEENVQVMVEKSGLPGPMAQTLIRQFAELESSIKSLDFFQSPAFKASQDAKANIERYLGHPPTRLFEWVEQNKTKFGP
ncbi:hypothetical protein V494_06429 [Pseudogymnoascus sp. VKM F-4513 (FW-928)]|nr:hypothetical protein V494_06429 [Pseudogymnoascus sp. VKM F-4513 (FW-928)]